MQWFNKLTQRLYLLCPNTRENQSLREENAVLKKLLIDQQTINEELLEDSLTDSKTKAYNHRYLKKHLASLFAQHERIEKTLAVIVVDMDNFKTVNDTCGHDAGDEVLTQSTRIFNEMVREGDIVARVGGDEFVIIATNVTENHTLYSLTKRLHEGIATLTIKDCDVKISLSIGVCVVGKNEDNKMVLTPQEALKLADKAMYVSKGRGRNQTTFA
jgi:diguanylate cyclase (GGDEF)-like protein